MISETHGKGWMVQLTTTEELMASVRIYPVNGITFGPAPFLYSCDHLQAAVTARLKANAVEAQRGTPEERERAKRLLTSRAPVTGSVCWFEDAKVMRQFMLDLCDKYGETPAAARRLVSEWIFASSHHLSPQGQG